MTLRPTLKGVDLMRPDLLCCPFCGSEARLDNTVTEAVIRCIASYCGASIKRRHVPSSDMPGIERAVSAWNCRT